MAYASRAGRCRTSPTRPLAQAVCDGCGFWYQRHTLRYQFEWGGTQLINLQHLKCHRCLDKPNPQLRALVIPADPLPIDNPRPESFVEDEA